MVVVNWSKGSFGGMVSGAIGVVVVLRVMMLFWFVDSMVRVISFASVAWWQCFVSSCGLGMEK
jgi:hypothetical protein